MHEPDRLNHPVPEIYNSPRDLLWHDSFISRTGRNTREEAAIISWLSRRRGKTSRLIEHNTRNGPRVVDTATVRNVNRTLKRPRTRSIHSAGRGRIEEGEDTRGLLCRGYCFPEGYCLKSISTRIPPIGKHLKKSLFAVERPTPVRLNGTTTGIRATAGDRGSQPTRLTY